MNRKRYILTYLTSCLLCFIFLNSTSSYGGYREAVEILETKGKILFRLPSGIKWLRLKSGAKIPIGCLLQVTENSQVKLKIAPALSRNHRAKELVVTIREPIIIRLSRNLLRSVKFDPTYLWKMPKISPSQPDESAPPEAPLLMDIGDAWQRITAVFSGRKKNSESFLGPENNIDIAIRSDAISLLSPLPTEYLVSSYFPLGFRLAWEKPPHFKGRFVVYFWKSSAKTRRAISVTKKSFYTATISHWGTYFVQIQSENGHLQSKLHRIVVLDENKNNFSQKEPLATKISLNFPKNNAVIKFSKDHLTNFVWNRGSKVHSRQDLSVLKIADADSKNIQSFSSKSGYYSTALQPGNYYWWVETEEGVKADLNQRRTLQIITNLGQSDKDYFSVALQNIFKKTENGQVIFD